MDDSQTLDNEINRFGRALQEQGLDATGYSKSNLQYLYNVSKLCAKQSGIQAGAFAGLAGAAAGGTITIGALTLPMYVAGFLAGFVGGTTQCVMARCAIKPVLDDLLKFNSNQ